MDHSYECSFQDVQAAATMTILDKSPRLAAVELARRLHGSGVRREVYAVSVRNKVTSARYEIGEHEIDPLAPIPRPFSARPRRAETASVTRKGSRSSRASGYRGGHDAS